MADAFRSCPFCKHTWTGPADPAAACPKCGRANTTADDATPPPSQAPAAVKATPRKVAPRPIAAPKSHTARNVFSLVLGLGLGTGALWYLKIWPFSRTEMVGPETFDEKKKTAEKPKPPEERPKPVEERPKEIDKPKPVEQKPPEPKKPPVEPAPDYAKEKAYKVVKVTSGDTFVVKGDGKDITVRLIGAAAAKPGDPPIRGIRDGKESHERLKALLANQQVHLYYGILDTATSRAIRDQYGTDRAWVFRASDGMFVNLEMVRGGFARYDPADAKEFAESFQYWDEKAREE